MMSKKCIVLMVSVLLSGVFSVSVLADESKTLSVDEIKAHVMDLLPRGEVIDEIADAPIEGFYQVVHGPRMFYISKDGRYMMQAKIYDIKAREDITENRLRRARLEAIEAVGGDHMITYAPAPPKVSNHTITVFTDIDCGYCRKLHSEMKQYNDAGITVRYLFFPRAGMTSNSAKKAIAVYCSDDPKKALDEAKLQNKVEFKECENNVAEQYRLGQRIGVNGTPALVSDKGDLIPGYVPAEMLLQRLNANEG